MAVALTLTTVARADFNPVPLTPGSFTADVVIEKTAPKAFSDYVNATMDNGTNNFSFTWFEQGFDKTRTAFGLPTHGSTFSAVSDANHSFVMPPTYATNNAVCVYSALPNGSLKLSTPKAFTTLSVLNSGGGGSSTINYTVHHQGGADETGTLDINDWFNNSATTIAWNANGRINMDSGQLGNLYNTTPNLFYNDIFLTDTVNPVSGIDFASTSGNRAVIFGVSGSTDGSTFTPVTVSGFNRDMVVEAGVTPPGVLFTKTTVVMDSGATNNIGNTFYEVGFNTAAPTTGVPAHGSSFTVGATPHTFTMAPDYTVNNVIYLGGYDGYTSGTFTLRNPASYTGLSFLNSAGNGPVTITVWVNHQNGNSEYFTFNATDWFGGTAAYTANGRVQTDTLALNDVNGGACRLFFNDITLADSSPVTSIRLDYTSGGRAGIFAVAGQSTAGGNFNPVGVTGYNADLIVEASAARFPGSLYTASNVSMDGGTNNTGATWYEQGYYAAMPNSGLPAAGSSLTSASKADHHYQMAASYAANNAVFVDYAHTNANLTLATPTAYSALSFLSATANGRVTNQCIMQYADGTQETNTFVSLDWFNNSPYAFSSLGRLNLDTRTINNDPGRTGTPNPRLYEAEFALGNVTSPLTNVVLQFLGAENATSGRMVVLAVSATAGAVPPIIRTQPQSVFTYETSNVVFAAVMGGGTAPISYQWQKGTNNVWVNLADGGNISGATTATLSITAATLNNLGDYRLVISNVAGTVNSATATLQLVSPLPDVTAPGDSITAYQPNGGGTPAAEGVANAINNDSTKYLNFGANSGTTFVGPLGFVVTPAKGSTIVTAMRLYTANDSADRDPADYTLEGSNDGGNTFTVIAQGSLALPDGRNGAGAAVNPLTQYMQEVRFANATGYKTYRWSCSNVKGSTYMLQIGEVELLGVQTPVAPVIVSQPAPTIKTWVGASPTLAVSAYGYPTNLTYQWSLNGSPIAGATSSSYTLSNVQLTDSGKSFTCTVANSAGTATSVSATLSVIAKPNQPYVSAILADNPAGYWRLNEADNAMGNNGTVANDYWGGHSGIYSNVVLQVPGVTPATSADTAAQFGTLATSDSFAGGIAGVDFAKPTNSSAAFSIEAWVKGPAQTLDAGIVTKGYGNGGEQFNLDTGGNNHAFRFFVRDVAGNTHGAVGTKATDDNWHHVVAVCDEANSNIVLYVDGRQNGTGSISPWSGLMSSTSPMSIGSRQSGKDSAYDSQFTGVIDEVAVYSFALSSNQVLNHYYAANPAPIVTQDPTNTTVAEGTSASFTVGAYGPAPLSYQWYNVTGGGWSALAGKTSATLTLSTVPVSLTGNSYQVVVSNPYGAVTSAVASVTVYSGPPSILTDLPMEVAVYAGRTASLAVTVGGTAPFTFQWQKNGVNLTDGGRILGARSNVLSIANAQSTDTGSYQLLVSNASGGPVPSTMTALSVLTIPTFNTNGVGWTLNGDANGNPTIMGNVLALTDGNNSEARSAYFNYPLYIKAFRATFTYQDIGGGGADGFAFVVQNDPRGTAALGGAGGSMGYGGLTPSAALLFNIYGNNTPGIAWRLNGAVGTPFATTDPVGIAGGNPIAVSLTYVQGVLQVSLKDTVVGATFNTNLSVGDLPAVVGGDTAYVGISAATGGIASSQQVSNFAFISYPTLTAQVTSTNTVLLSWPASVGGYVLQSKADLGSSSWQTVTTSASAVNGQMVVPASGNQFYRLVLP